MTGAETAYIVVVIAAFAGLAVALVWNEGGWRKWKGL